MADGWGGKRPGAGRKPKAVTELRRQALDNAGGDAEQAFAFIIDTMKNPRAPLQTRLACAQIITDRVWGKPTQRNENQNSGDLRVIIEHVTKCEDSDTGVALSPDEGQG